MRTIAIAFAAAMAFGLSAPAVAANAGGQTPAVQTESAAARIADELSAQRHHLGKRRGGFDRHRSHRHRHWHHRHHWHGRHHWRHHRHCFRVWSHGRRIRVCR